MYGVNLRPTLKMNVMSCTVTRALEVSVTTFISDMLKESCPDQ